MFVPPSGGGGGGGGLFSGVNLNAAPAPDTQFHLPHPQGGAPGFGPGGPMPHGPSAYGVNPANTGSAANMHRFGPIPGFVPPPVTPVTSYNNAGVGGPGLFSHAGAGAAGAFSGMHGGYHMVQAALNDPVAAAQLMQSPSWNQLVGSNPELAAKIQTSVNVSAETSRLEIAGMGATLAAQKAEILMKNEALVQKATETASNQAINAGSKAAQQSDKILQ